MEDNLDNKPYSQMMVIGIGISYNLCYNKNMYFGKT